MKHFEPQPKFFVKMMPECNESHYDTPHLNLMRYVLAQFIVDYRSQNGALRDECEREFSSHSIDWIAELCGVTRLQLSNWMLADLSGETNAL